MKISASILAADFTRLGDQIAECQAAGVDWIHFDVMDGHFVHNLSLGPVVVEAARRITRLPLDVHLMTEEPERYLEDFAAAGADGLTVQLEACPHIHRVLQQIKDLGKQAGVALNPGTPACALSEIICEADLVMVMTVNPGYAGQKFIPLVLPKIKQIREMITSRCLTTNVEVDGGINPTTAPKVVKAGADVLVVSSAIFKTRGSIAEAVTRLRQSTSGAEPPAA